MYDLSLLVLTKNEANKIAHMLKSVFSLVKEVIVIDTGSTDRTKEIIKEVRPDAKIFYEPFTNFSALLNIGISHCTSKWILALDADESILFAEYYLLGELLSQKEYDTWQIPRKHWEDLEMKKWYKAKDWYPNYAPKLFLNNGEIKFKGYISPTFIGNTKLGTVENGFHIQHFNLFYNTHKIFVEKQNLYDKLIAKQQEDDKKKLLPYDMTVLTLVYDKATSYIEHMLRSIKGLAKEYVFVDNGKQYKCSKIIKKIIPNAKIYKKKFTNFGNLSNIGISHCTSKWILALDTDEWIAPEEKKLFAPLLNQHIYDMFSIPRKHWRNLKRTAENGGWHAKPYPDGQARLFLNNGKIKYTGYVHCGREGFKTMHRVINGLHIHHFSYVFCAKEVHYALYERLQREGTIAYKKKMAKQRKRKEKK